jgi:hypothetical protein
LENYLEKFLKLEESYNCPVEKKLLYRFFGKKFVDGHIQQSSMYKIQNSWVGSKETLKHVINKKISNQKMTEAKRFVWVFRIIPWIKFAGVTGDVAFGSAKENADIDIFLVVQDKRLWITRGIEIVILGILGMRRFTWKTDVKNKFCINYYTSESNLNLKPISGNRFLVALEIAMMKPIYNTSYYKHILAENSWIRKYFPELKGSNKKQKSPRIFGFSHIWDMLDWTAMQMEVVFMKIMGHSMKNSSLSRDRITFFDRNSQWQSREQML